MIPRLARDEAPAPRSTDLVDGWLRVFLSLLKLPQAQAASIREELEGHLRERVRDLMVAGAAEGEATRQAISELGEAADVAARYRALRTEPRRRLIMQATLFTAAGAALALSIAAFRGGQPQPDTQKEAAKALLLERYLQATLASADPARRNPVVLSELLDRAAQSSVELSPDVRSSVLATLMAAREGAGAAAYVPQTIPPELAGIKADWSFKDAPPRDAFEFLGKVAKLPVNVRWNLFTPEMGVEADSPALTMQARQAGVGAFLRAINEAAQMASDPPASVRPGAAVELRVIDGVIEVAPRAFFDQRERELVSYDLSGIIAARTATYNEEREKVVEEVRGVIMRFVDADEWRDNGGELAEMTVVGDRLFVNAPARFHPQIRWILSQLPSGVPRADAAPARSNTGGVTVVQVYPLKHTAPDELLPVLRTMESIKSIDFGRVMSDQRTNSIVCSATPQEHELFKVALESLDREAAKP